MVRILIHHVEVLHVDRLLAVVDVAVVAVVAGVRVVAAVAGVVERPQPQ